MSELIFQTSPIVTVATNKFINIPIILRFEDTNLIEIIKQEDLCYTTQIPIYHPDGTYLAKVNGTRMYLTEDGKKTGLKLEKLATLTVLKLDKQTLFEIKHGVGDSFKTQAELYTPDGYFVKLDNTSAPQIISQSDEGLHVSGILMKGNTFQGGRIGIWVKKDGSVLMGVN